MRIILVALLSGAVGVAVGSDFDGKTVRAEWRVPQFNDVLFGENVTVGAGAEIVRPLGDVYNIDLEGEFIQFDFVVAGGTTFFGGGTFNGWLFSDVEDVLTKIEGYEIDSASFGVTGLDEIEVGYHEDAVWADFDGVVVPNAGDFIRMKVFFAIFEENFEGDLPID